VNAGSARRPGRIMKLIKGASILVAAATVIVSAQSRTADNPQAVVRDFMRAVYARDIQRVKDLAVPDNYALEVLNNKEPVSKARLAEIDTESKSLKLEQTEPFRCQGKPLAPGANGAYPDGTTVRYMTAFEGNLTVISIVKRSGRWLVDARWWLKMKEMSLRSDDAEPDEKELVIKTFLMNLLRMNRSGVSRTLIPGADLDVVFMGAPRVPEPSDVLYELALDMPLVEADADEAYQLPSGKVVKRGAGANETVLVGLYGPSEMVFQLRKVDGKWRVVPESYYGILNR